MSVANTTMWADQNSAKKARHLRELYRRCSSMETEQSAELVIPRQLLCCKLCDEEFTKPSYLPCLHTFCYKCIEEHRQKTIDSEGFFPCPTCMTETTLTPEDSIKSLPENILARRLSVPAPETVKRETICRFCKNAGNFVDGVSFCKNCDDFLCQGCTDSHNSQEEYVDHDYQSIEEYNAKTDDNTTCSPPDRIIPTCCDGFDQYDIGALFCVDCDMSVCSDCHAAGHDDHRCAELVAVAQNFEVKIKEPLSELENDTKDLAKAMEDLDASEHEVLEQKQVLNKRVKERTKVLCGLIHDYENLLLEEINRRHEENLENIRIKRYDMQMHMEAIKGVKDFTNNLITYGSYEEKVFMRKKVGYRIRELCEEPLSNGLVETTKVKLTEPMVTVESICDMFGVLNEENSVSSSQATANKNTDDEAKYNGYHQSTDSGQGSEIMENGDQEPELVEIFGRNDFQHDQNSNSDTDMLSASNTSENLRNVKFSEEIKQTEYEQENCFELENPKREVVLPQAIQRECIKGIGVNEYGDIIVGTTTTVHVLEKRGIVRGKIQLEQGWNIHSVSSDGKVALTVPRGDNRFKVRVLKNDGTGHILSDSHVESFGLNFVTADKKGTLIITSNRYAQIRMSHGKSAKSGGNIAFYNPDGSLLRRITNEDFHDKGLYLLEKPQCIVVDDKRENIYVTDPGSHSVIGFDKNGELIFEYGNTDTEGEIYQGPDLVSVDKYGNIIVTDKREGRIDILGPKGTLKKSFYTDDIPRFVGATPEKLLLTVMPDGTLKFYEYLT